MDKKPENLDDLLGDTKSKIKSYTRQSNEIKINLQSAKEFYDEFDVQVENKLYNFVKEVKAARKELLDQNTPSRILEFNQDGKYKWKTIKTTKELKEAIKTSESNADYFVRLREKRTLDGLRKFKESKKTKEDLFGGFGFSDEMLSDNGNALGSFPNRTEFTPLIATPFFKQMYLYDYLRMHSQAFWYRNYSAIAKNMTNLIRSFVIGEGFSVTIDDSDDIGKKAAQAWKDYEERSRIHEEIGNWCDELSTFGELMLKKIFTPAGLIHKSIDPSTIWEIVTDPEDITDVKYYHQQYSTQYQLYSTKDAPITKYIIDQIPPDLVHHIKVNCTSFEKRGRSDLLAAMLYFKYFEDYMQAKLLRAKNEAAFMWDVTVKGDANDVAAYISQTQNIMDVPPGSENVHNEAITRTPLAPTFGRASGDDIAKWIVSYICMSENIPATYMGTMETGGIGTKAGALVATDPINKRMEDRRKKVEQLLHKIADDVFMEAGLDPKDVTIEFNFPELISEDRSKKIGDVITAMDSQIISKETGANIIAKELNISTYDYDEEQKKIKEEQTEAGLFMGVGPDAMAGGGPMGGGEPPQKQLTTDKNSGETKHSRIFDRTDARDKNSTM